MKPTNIHLRDDQRKNLTSIGRSRDPQNSMAEEVREAVDSHIKIHLPAKPKKPASSK